VSIIFGDKDWMDTRGSSHIIKQNKFFASGESNLYVLEKSGHRMPTMQPEGFCKILIEDINGTAKHVF